MGGVGASSRGGGKGAGRRWGEGPYAGAAPPLRAAQPRVLSPRGGRLHLHPPPSPSQFGKTALDLANLHPVGKAIKSTEVVKILEKAPAKVAKDR